ncbi:MAG TPA: hypothetical protein VHY20_05340 [Pirellulales bacterium]|nr:hypothetical protein [Pirellulales bacterium]
MFHWLSNQRAAWISGGLIAGLIIGGLLPASPLHATATDRSENYAIATGLVEQGVEALYTLDFLTGQLSAFILNPGTRTFGNVYHHNVLRDLKVEQGRPPRFMMVTGDAFLRTGGNIQMSQAVVYVADMQSGFLAAYVLPYNPAAISIRPQAAPNPQDLLLLSVIPIRTVAVRGG